MTTPLLRPLLLAALLLFAPCDLAGQDRPPRPDTLSPPVFRIEGIEATATRLDRSAEELAVSINIVGRAAITGRPNRLLLDALVGEPGLQIQQTTAGQGAAFVRALTGSHVLLLVDGVRLNNGTFRQGPSHYLATVDPEAVERVEVVRGASSTLYGSDAIGGVVNVVTRHPRSLLGPDARSAMEGSYTFDGATRGNRVRLGSAVALPLLDGLEVMAGGSYASHGHLRPGGGLPRQDPTAFDQWGGDLRLDLRVSPRLRTEIGLQHSAFGDVHRYDRYVDFRAPGLPGGGPGQNNLFVFSPQARSLARARVELHVDRTWLSILDLRVSYQEQIEGRSTRGWTDAAGSEPRDPAAILRHEHDGVRSLALDLQGKTLGLDDGRTDLTFGLEGWSNRTDSRGWREDLESGVRTPSFRESGGIAVPTGRFPDASTFDGAAAYLFVDRAFGTSLRIQTGGRASAYSTTTRVGDAFGGDVDTNIGDFSGEVGAIWMLSPEWRVSGRFAQAFRAPNIYDLTLIGEIPGGFSLPSAELRAENSHTIDAAARFERGRFRAEATLFRVRIDDMIDRVLDAEAEPPPDVPPDTRILRVRNVGHALIHGVEGGMSVSVPDGPLEGVRLSLSGAWTYGNARVVRDGEPLDEPLGRVPPPSVTTRIRLPFSPGRLGGPAGSGQGSLALEREGGVEYFFMAAAAQERLGFRDVLDSRIRPGGTPGYQVHALRAFLQLTEGARMSVSLENVFDRLYRAHGSGIDSAGRHLLVRLDVRR